MKVKSQVQIASSVVALIVCALVGGALPASAGLGGNQNSIQSDASALGGKMSEQRGSLDSEPAGGLVVMSFVTGNGVTVREYSAPSGPVFAVAWEGRRPPDLRVLLGSYYAEYVAAAAAHKRPMGLHRAVIAGPNSVFFLSGHMGRPVGGAYAPGLAPAGVDPKALEQ